MVPMDGVQYIVTPDGSRWFRGESGKGTHGHDELFKYDHDDYRDNKAFTYERLTSMTRRIRLLRLLPGSEKSEVVCELFEAELKNGRAYLCSSTTEKEIPYEALSWSWGIGPKENLILIRKQGMNERAKASESLVWALRHLRSKNKDRVLWIDAICIDQESVEEKNHQVQMMGQSYASRTCIWLGKADSKSHMAINFIKHEILRLDQFDTLCTDEKNAEKWQSLLLLMQRDWFFRRWVVQEIALAKEAVVYCGSDEIDWKDFSVAVELFVEVETATHRLSEVMQKDPRFYHVPGWFEYVSALGASLLVEATGMVFRYYKPVKTITDMSQKLSGTDQAERKDEANGGHAETNAVDPISQRRPLLSLEYLVSKLSIFRASEPRDSIYALLAIANDGYPAPQGPDDEEGLRGAHEAFSKAAEQKPFPVNYAHPYPDVCQDFIQFCIGRSNKTRALDILCRPFAPDADSNVSKYINPKPRSRQMDDYIAILDNFHVGDDPKHNEHWDQMLKYFPKRKGDDQEVRLPSWIPRLSSAPFEMYNQAGVPIQKLGRKNADPLVALPGQSMNYDAAQSTVLDEKSLHFKKRRAQDAHCMFIKGFILTEVAETTDSSQAGSIPEEWFKLAGWATKDYSEPNEEFWRTLVADRGKDGRNPPSYYSRACKESVFKGGLPSGSVSTTDLINNERNSIITQFCRRVQAVIWNRQLIKTGLEHLGITRKGVKKGDLVCILYGCSVPVILRRHNKTKEQIAEEEEEDRLFGKLVRRLQDEKFLRRLMQKLRRRKKYQELPESYTKEDRDAGRWWLSKEGVGEYKRWYEEEYEKKEDAKTDNPTQREVQQKSPAKAGEGSKEKPLEKAQEESQEESQEKANKAANESRRPIEEACCYYEFLGECYIHGMMDGEAIREKSKRDEKRLKKKAASAANAELGKEKPGPGTPNTVQQKNGLIADSAQYSVIQAEQAVKDGNGKTDIQLPISAPKMSKRRTSKISGTVNSNGAIPAAGATHTRESQGADPKLSKTDEKSKDEGTKDERQPKPAEAAEAVEQRPLTAEEWKNYFLHDLVFELR